jgi:hypothetical protein
MVDSGALGRLDAAGVTAGCNDEQRRALADLSSVEVSVLTSIKERLDAATADVTAHADGDGGVFW